MPSVPQSYLKSQLKENILDQIFTVGFFHKPLCKDKVLKESRVPCQSLAQISLLIQKEYAIFVHFQCNQSHWAGWRWGGDGDF